VTSLTSNLSRSRAATHWWAHNTKSPRFEVWFSAVDSLSDSYHHVQTTTYIRNYY